MAYQSESPDRDAPFASGLDRSSIAGGEYVPGSTSVLDTTLTPVSRMKVRLGAIVRDALEAVVLAVVLFGVLQIGIQNTVVEGSSMEPNFVDGERLLVNRLAYRWSAPKRGDVIVFHAPEQEGKDFIKRVIGLPGDTVAIEDGSVRLNGDVLAEPWLPARDHGAFAPFTVPSDRYFVLGDNRANSNDSRSWNEALPRERIVGKVWLSVWPRHAWGLVKADGPAPAAWQAVK